MTRYGMDDAAWASIILSLPFPQRKVYDSLTPGEQLNLREISWDSETPIGDFLSDSKLRRFALKLFYTTPMELRGEETYYVRLVRLATKMASTIGRFENDHPARKDPTSWGRLRRVVKALRDLCNDILRQMGEKDA